MDGGALIQFSYIQFYLYNGNSQQQLPWGFLYGKVKTLQQWWSMTAEKVQVGKRFENIANVCNEKYFFPFASKSRPDFREILHAIHEYMWCNTSKQCLKKYNKNSGSTGSWHTDLIKNPSFGSFGSFVMYCYVKSFKIQLSIRSHVHTSLLMIYQFLLLSFEQKHIPAPLCFT